MFQYTSADIEPRNEPKAKSFLVHYTPADLDFSDDKNSRLIDTESSLVQYALIDIEPRNCKPVSVSFPLFYYPSSNDEVENYVTKRNDNNKITEPRHQSAKIQPLSKVSSHQSLCVQARKELNICNIKWWPETRIARY